MMTDEDRMACIEAWSSHSWGDRLGEVVRICIAVEKAANPQPKAVPPTAPLPEPDFTLDGDTTACYYAETVTRLLAASQPQPESVRELTVVEIMRLGAEAKDSIVDFARAVLAAKGTK